MKKTFLFLCIFGVTSAAIASEKEACRIDVFLKVKPGALSSWVKADYSDAGALECLIKAGELMEKNDKINIVIDDKEMNIKGKLEYRKP